MDSPYDPTAPESPYQNHTRFSFSPSSRPSLDRREDYPTNPDSLSRMDRVRTQPYLRPPPKRVSAAPSQAQSESTQEPLDENLREEASRSFDDLSMSRRRKQI